MSESTLVPLQQLRQRLRAAPAAWPIELPAPPTETSAHAAGPLDRLNRPLHDLRISVTDRCNFRCSYCMPRHVFGKDHDFLPKPELLSFEEITRSARIFVGLGVRKLRLTGGEPLLRRHLERLVEELKQLKMPDGQAPELALTTNGSVLALKARALKDAGLKRVTVSLDALDDTVFRRMNDADFPVSDVLAGIEAAQAVGLGPIKVNMVVQRGVNDDQILPLARHFRGTGIELRFIEFMDVGTTNGWRMDQVLPSDQVRQRINHEFPLVAVEAHQVSETAQRWAYVDGQGTVGFISSVTHAFCGDCNRLRLSTDGRLFTCLFGSQGHDLRSLLRGNHPDDQIAAGLRQLWQGRSDRYSQLRAEGKTPQQRIEMSYIGG
ncbi:MAG: GTP 3',8-cyclase MoaA [Burkholderiales bacterium]|nr:GTP 3',8-cyclase MoaA [Burkholderiales bacterium]